MSKSNMVDNKLNSKILNRGRKMATNTGDGYRVGSVRGKTQFYSPRTKLYVKRGLDG